MNHYYYLVSQLPALPSSDDKAALPITEASFKELCARFLTPHEQKTVAALSLVPPREAPTTGSVFLDAWYEAERCLRFALAQVRAQKLRKEAQPLPGACTADIQQVARTAVGMDSPLQAEQYLFTFRMDTVHRLSPIDVFSIDGVYAYGIRLLLTARMKQFDRERGTASYHTIYDSILGETI
ncbi:MAG: hypothetical protein IJ191_05750 [Treponema sp.]|nr:hypothetical protein [Treponema sp.]